MGSPAVSSTALRITEIFFSLQGEARTVGRPTCFIRLTGCPLRCQYCDTAYAFSGGSSMSLQEILDQVHGFPTRLVTVTGGEPLAQPACLELLRVLCDEGYEVSLETSGALDVSEVDARVSRVVDLKTPGSGEVHRNRYENLALLDLKDQVKFVICDAADYQWARMKCVEYDLFDKVDEVLYSPSATELEPRDLADWILRDGDPVRMQLQLHKMIWGDEPGR
jgi:7-carboxy-7-deazaguanine synthase